MIKDFKYLPERLRNNFRIKTNGYVETTHYGYGSKVNTENVKHTFTSRPDNGIGNTKVGKANIGSILEDYKGLID
jgi:hypothetical protein